VAKLSKGKVAKWTAITIFIVLFAWGIYRQQAEASDLRLGLGFGITNSALVHGGSEGNGWIGQELMFTHKHWYGAAMRLGGDDVLPDTVRLTAGYRVEWRDERRLSPYLRLGAAYFLDEPSSIISDRWAYDLTMGFRVFDVLDIEYQHNSTAGRSSQNSGNDLLLVGLKVRF